MYFKIVTRYPTIVGIFLMVIFNTYVLGAFQ